MASTNWIASTGTWDVSNNWDNGIPTSATDTTISLGATATITADKSNDAALSLVIANFTFGQVTDLLVSGTLTVGGPVTLNVSSGGGGRLDVAAGGLFKQTTSDGIAVGNRGTLSVEGTLQANGGLSLVGNKAGAITVTVGTGGTLDVGRGSGDSSFAGAAVSLDGGTLLLGQGTLFTDALTTLTSTGDSRIGETQGMASGVEICNSGLIMSLSGTLTIDPLSPGTGQGINSTTGTVWAKGGVIDVDTNVTNSSTGAFDISDGGRLIFDFNVNANGEIVDFLADGGGARDGLLIVNNATQGLGTISGTTFTGPLVEDFNPSSTNKEAIDFRTLPFKATDTIAINSIGGKNVLQIMDGSTRVAYVGLGSGSVTDPSTLSLINDGFGGTEVVCFAAGTRIRTEHGQTKVEVLREGDKVATLSPDGIELRPVRWIGRRHVEIVRHPEPQNVSPVRIRRGAFADNVPERDLLLSPEHCVFADEVLIPARLLVNGTSVVQDRVLRDVTYFHIELDRHAILLAEGLSSESYLDTGNRALFENGGTAVLLHPEFSPSMRLHAWNRDSAAPLASLPEAERIWRRLSERAAYLGFKPDRKLTTTADADLHLLANGRRVSPLCLSKGRYAFVIPAGCGTVRLRSRASAPSELRPFIDDRRLLGVAVSRILSRNGNFIRETSVDDPRLCHGWWKPEQAGVVQWRWTNGDALLPVPKGTTMIELSLVPHPIGYVTSVAPGQADNLAA